MEVDLRVEVEPLEVDVDQVEVLETALARRKRKARRLKVGGCPGRKRAHTSSEESSMASGSLSSLSLFLPMAATVLLRFRLLAFPWGKWHKLRN